MCGLFMSTPDISGLASQAAALMRQRLGARGDTFALALRQRGRRLPRRIRRAAEELASAEALAAHPRLRQRLDLVRIERCGHMVLGHLRPLGTAERRWRLFLSVAGSMSFGLLATIAGVIAVLGWRGYL